MTVLMLKALKSFVPKHLKFIFLYQSASMVTNKTKGLQIIKEKKKTGKETKQHGNAVQDRILERSIRRRT